MRAWRPKPLDDAEAVRTIRQAVGPDFDLMIDLTAARPDWVWDFETGLLMAGAVEALPHLRRNAVDQKNLQNWRKNTPGSLPAGRDPQIRQNVGKK